MLWYTSSALSDFVYFCGYTAKLFLTESSVYTILVMFILTLNGAWTSLHCKEKSFGTALSQCQHGFKMVCKSNNNKKAKMRNETP